MFMRGTCKKTSLDIYGTVRVALVRKPWLELGVVIRNEDW